MLLMPTWKLQKTAWRMGASMVKQAMVSRDSGPERRVAGADVRPGGRFGGDFSAIQNIHIVLLGDP